MEPAQNQRPFAWQPLTPRGVAAFAGARWGRLLLVQLATALLAGLTVAWFLADDWFPTLKTAIERLPAQGNIQSGRLNWQGPSPCLLAESRFLALAVDLQHSGQIRSPAHLQVELGGNDIWVYSLFGCVQVAYPNGYWIGLNRDELKPWWGAWAPALLALAVPVVMSALLLSWAVLATVYWLPTWVLGLYCDRQLTLLGSWRLAGAALIPGALVLNATLVLYTLGGLDVVHLAATWGLHLLLGWIYLVFGVLARPRLTALSLKSSPFAQTEAAAANRKPNAAGPSANPFSSKP